MQTIMRRAELSEPSGLDPDSIVLNATNKWGVPNWYDIKEDLCHRDQDEVLRWTNAKFPSVAMTSSTSIRQVKWLMSMFGRGGAKECSAGIDIIEKMRTIHPGRRSTWPRMKSKDDVRYWCNAVYNA